MKTHRQPATVLLLSVPLVLIAGLFLPGSPARAQEPSPDGQVQIPLEIYNQLVENGRAPRELPRPAPASWTLGSARVTVQVREEGGRATARVTVALEAEVLEDGWVLVPVLPAATPVESATVGGKPVQLIAAPEGLAWSTREAGSYRMDLVYRVDAVRSEAGWALPLPVPAAAAIRLVATLPGEGLSAAVIPAAGTRVSSAGGNTTIEATVPTTRGVQLTWQAAAGRGHAISRARYTGRLAGNAVSWTGELDVELFEDAAVTLPLLPRSVTLSEVRVDGEEAVILTEGGELATLVRGRGPHQVRIGFEVPVERADGPPRVSLQVPEVPVSRFDLTLPGKKEVSAEPAANVTSRFANGATTAAVYAPMTRALTLRWAEAVPEEIRAEAHTNASLYHAVHAEEGVLSVRAVMLWEVRRGEASVLRFRVPPGVQVNRVDAPSGAVADWRLEPGEADGPRLVTVFLDRQLQGELALEVGYDRSLPTAQGTRTEVPLLTAEGAQRQRGMVALLAGKDLLLKPVEEDELAATRIGENQLPAFLREDLERAVVHTFKYVEQPPRLLVEARAPERREARFDAQVDTLVSLGEVALQGAAAVTVHVKSGRLAGLDLELPAGVNLLSLAGPSLRGSEVEGAQESTADASPQRIRVEFTQEMEGHFRLELAYERILGEGEADGTRELPVPTVRVVDAEVEQGRLAVEALSAVEVQAASEVNVKALDPGELPRQLVLRTTNPILLAYEYAAADEPAALRLRLRRHDLLEVQEAAIDRAVYRTLFTRDGLAVTAARFEVRNSRKQFLRLELPPGAAVWSAFVDGEAEKPALAAGRDRDGEDGGDGGDGSATAVLLKIARSSEGFPVEVVYAVPSARIRGLGRVSGALPRPDVLVTHTRWDVYLPAEMRYRGLSTDLDVRAHAVPKTAADLEDEMASLRREAAAVVAPLRIEVPAAGVCYVFEKLYANQREGGGGFTLAYASPAGENAARAASVLGVLLALAGLGAALGALPRLPAALSPRWGFAAAATGLVILGATVGVFRIGAGAALTTLALAASAFALYRAWRWWRGRGGELEEDYGV